MILFYNNFKGYWVKAEIVCRGEEILKVLPAPAYEVPFPPIFSSMLFYKMVTLFYKTVTLFYKMVTLFIIYADTVLKYGDIILKYADIVLKYADIVL